jgi:hypothetical protein
MQNARQKVCVCVGEGGGGAGMYKADGIVVDDKVEKANYTITVNDRITIAIKPTSRCAQAPLPA